MARTLIASDNFDSYTDAANLGAQANWLELNDSTALLRVTKPASDGEIWNPFSAAAQCRWDGSGSFSGDQYSKATLTQIGANGTTSWYTGVMVRASADLISNRDYYALEVGEHVTLGSRPTRVVKYVNDSATTLSNVTGDNWAAGDTIELEAVTNGADCDLLVYRNGSLLRTVTDSSSPLTGGKPGLVGYGGGTTTDAIKLDDWEGGDVTGGGASNVPLNILVPKQGIFLASSHGR